MVSWINILRTLLWCFQHCNSDNWIQTLTSSNRYHHWNSNWKLQSQLFFRPRVLSHDLALWPEQSAISLGFYRMIKGCESSPVELSESWMLPVVPEQLMNSHLQKTSSPLSVLKRDIWRSSGSNFSCLRQRWHSITHKSGASPKNWTQKISG